MKSEHRHELKENELSKFIASLPQFYQDNQKMIIYIGVVAILVILSTWFTIFRKRDEKLRAQSLATGEILSVQMEKSRVLQDLAQGQDSSMMLASKSDKLKELSATTICIETPRSGGGGGGGGPKPPKRRRLSSAAAVGFSSTD